MSSNHKLKHFFTGSGLPWTTSIKNSLEEDGYDSRETVKFMESSEWFALFSDKKAAKQRLAYHMFEELKKEEVEPIQVRNRYPICISSSK